MSRPALLALLLAAALPACHAGSPGLHTERGHGFAIAVPPGIVLRKDFARNYFGEGSWKAYAEPGSQGQPVLALVLPGSNDITSGELRIGVSERPAELARCTALPATASPAQGEPATLAGANFVRFRAGDAAMNHYLQVESYRGVHGGRCYAIDLMVYGTNPEVYDPPRQAPFGKAQAFERLHTLLQGFRFLN